MIFRRKNWFTVTKLGDWYGSEYGCEGNSEWMCEWRQNGDGTYQEVYVGRRGGGY